MKKPTLHSTLAAVAQEAGVSKMTASRALRNTGRVSAETIRRVTAAAAQLGYRPNPLVQTLMTGVRKQKIERAASIAWVTTYPEGTAPPASVQAVENAARERCRELGYGLERIHINDPNFTMHSIPRIFQARGIRAAIIGPMQYPGEIPNFPFAAFASAAVGRSLSQPALHYTMTHHFHSMTRMLQELVRRGYQRIGFLHSTEMNTRFEHGTLMVFEHYCLQNGVNPLQAHQSHDGWNRSSYRAWFNAFQPDAIIVDAPQIAEFLLKSQIPVGKSVDVATMSWQAKFPDCTGILHPFAALGSGTVDLVVAQLHRNERGIPKHQKAMLFEGDWIEGKTLRAAKI